jgi:hypothetical protein
MTIDQLERMKTHELADLLSNVVLLLRRMPNVECRQFTSQRPEIPVIDPPPISPSPAGPHKGTKTAKPKQVVDSIEKVVEPLSAQSTWTVAEPLPAQSKWTVADLEGKTVSQLKEIATDLNLRLSSSLKKNELLAKLTAKLSRTHSEQYAIQDI